MLLPKRCTLRWWFVFFSCFLLQSRRALAALCEGKVNLDDFGSQVCGNFSNETSCNDAFDSSLCRWEMERGGCNVTVATPSSFPCSELMIDNPQDCNKIHGCYWAEIPVWVWLAINVPVWLLVAAVCLICYHRHVGPSRIVVYDRSESVTIGDNSSHLIEEHEERNQDISSNPILPAVNSKAISESEASSNETSALEIEDGVS